MDGRFVAFVTISALLIVTPGPDMALVTRNALRSGRRAATRTAFGIGLGTFVWGVGSVLGVAVILQKSAVAFTVLKLAGAAYLIYLGIRAFLAGSSRVSDREPEADERGFEHRAAFLQGLLGNLLNPKAGAIWVTVIPQFIRPEDAGLRLIVMLAVFEAILVGWLVVYGSLIARSGRGRAGRRVRKIVNRVTGAVLIGLGGHVALERN
jgi:RhtB (resistance to homoserine/threonine) family protein